MQQLYKEDERPSALIEVRQRYSPEIESKIMEAVYVALREAFEMLSGDRMRGYFCLYMNQIDLNVHRPEKGLRITHKQELTALQVGRFRLICGVQHEG